MKESKIWGKKSYYDQKNLLPFLCKSLMVRSWKGFRWSDHARGELKDELFTLSTHRRFYSVPKELIHLSPTSTTAIIAVGCGESIFHLVLVAGGVYPASSQN